MTFNPCRSKNFQLLQVILLSFSVRATELDTKKIGADEKRTSYLQTMFKAGTIAENISSQKLALHVVKDMNVCKEIFQFVGITYRYIKTLRVKNNPRALAQCGNNKLAIAQGWNIDIFDLSTFLKVKTLGKTKKWCDNGSSSDVYSLAALPNNELAAGLFENIEIWNITTGVCIRNWKAGSESPISALTASPSGMLISGSRDGWIKLWDATSAICLTEVRAYKRPDISVRRGMHLLGLGIDAEYLGVCRKTCS
jgi:WD40 repeat protein